MCLVRRRWRHPMARDSSPDCAVLQWRRSAAHGVSNAVSCSTYRDTRGRILLERKGIRFSLCSGCHSTELVGKSVLCLSETFEMVATVGSDGAFVDGDTELLIM